MTCSEADVYSQVVHSDHVDGASGQLRCHHEYWTLGCPPSLSREETAGTPRVGPGRSRERWQAGRSSRQPSPAREPHPLASRPDHAFAYHRRRIADAVESFRHRRDRRPSRPRAASYPQPAPSPGDVGCLLIADDGRQRRDQHQAAPDVFADARLVELRALDREGAELLAAIRQNPRHVQHVVDDDRPHRVEFEVALGAGERDRRCRRRVTWMQTMTIASHWVGLTLPGMIELPGSFAGRLQLADAAARPRCEPSDVVGEPSSAPPRRERSAGDWPRPSRPGQPWAA